MNKEIKLKIKGIAGKDGVTPIIGVDYFTQEEQRAFVSEIMSKIPKAKDGVDGESAKPVDYKKIEKFIKEEVSKIEISKIENIILPETPVDIENIILRINTQIIEEKFLKENDLNKLKEEIYFYIARSRSVSASTASTQNIELQIGKFESYPNAFKKFTYTGEDITLVQNYENNTETTLLTDVAIAYDVDGNVDTLTKNDYRAGGITITKTFAYDVDGNLVSIT